MPRRIEYDPEAFRKAVMRAFWEKGYAATSVRDLEKATGLNRRQLFRESDDKRDLFLTAMKDFMAVSKRMYLLPLSQVGGLETIRQVLQELVDLSSGAPQWFGCLICNTCREPIALADSEVSGLIDSHMLSIEEAYAAALAKASDLGEVTLDSGRLRSAARRFLGIHVSLLVLVRAGTPRSVLEDIAREGLVGLG
ncbi:MAG: helix-turn-helix domain-containing protein [Acidobacteriota bacterium]